MLPLSAKDEIVRIGPEVLESMAFRKVRLAGYTEFGKCGVGGIRMMGRTHLKRMANDKRNILACGN